MSATIVEITPNDFETIWPVIEPTLAGGDAFALAYDKEAARAMWNDPKRRRYAAMEDERCVGTYFFGPNQQGPGAHVANAGYVVAPDARGRGIAKQMCLHSLAEARRAGFFAMQFNIVVSTNESAIRAWAACGFRIAGTLPGAFKHPRYGYVDAYVMHRML